MSVLTEVGPSELRTFRDCARKWAFKRKELGGIVEPSSPAQSFGTALHKIQEDYLVHDIRHPDTPMGKLAALAKPFLPLPGAEGLKVEKRVFVKGGDGWVFAGTPDLRVSVPGRDPSFLFDHKTTGNLKYALSAPALLADPQLIIYGSATLEESGAGSLVARWLYYLKGAEPDLRLVEPRAIPARDLAASLNGLRPDAEAMVSLVDKKRNPMDIPEPPGFGTSKAPCKSYGGCAFRSKCGVALTPWEKQKEEDKMATDRLKALLEAKQKREGVTSGEVSAATAGLGSPGQLLESGETIEEAIQATGINPPDAAEPIAELPPEPAKEKKTRAKKTKESEGPSLTADLGDISAPSLMVFADCVVSGVTVMTSFRDLVLEAEAAVAEAFNVPDYRLVEYGRGQGALVAAAKKLMAGLSGDVFVDLSSPSQRLCFDALQSIATKVVRGIR